MILSSGDSVSLSLLCGRNDLNRARLRIGYHCDHRRPGFDAKSQEEMPTFHREQKHDRKDKKRFKWVDFISSSAHSLMYHLPVFQHRTGTNPIDHPLPQKTSVCGLLCSGKYAGCSFLHITYQMHLANV